MSLFIQFHEILKHHKNVFTKWFHLQVILSKAPEDHAAAKF